MNGDTIIIYTLAYNAEETIQRTIDSVRAQTYENWLWFLVDNGSTDETGKIIMRNALEDCRIVPIGLRDNSLNTLKKNLPNLLSKYPDASFFSIDADDAILPRCLERLRRFMVENDLDIAACGWEYIEESRTLGERVEKVRKLDADLILEGRDFAGKFRVYKPFTNMLWGKLYKCSVVDEAAFYIPSLFHDDSRIVLKLFANAKRAGVLAEVLHQSYVRNGSWAQECMGIHAPGVPAAGAVRGVEFKIGWDEVDAAYREYEAYLKRYGAISPENRDYLYAIYLGWLHENLLQLYLGQPLDDAVLTCRRLTELLHSEVFRRVFTHVPASDTYRNLRRRGELLRQMYRFAEFFESFEPQQAMTKQIKKEISELMGGLGL